MIVEQTNPENVLIGFWIDTFWQKSGQIVYCGDQYSPASWDVVVLLTSKQGRAAKITDQLCIAEHQTHFVGWCNQ